jgi:hypothetical protein
MLQEGKIEIKYKDLDMAITTKGGPHHTNYVTLQSRLDSLPILGVEVTKDYDFQLIELAKQGFFKVPGGFYKCFYCSLQLMFVYDDEIQSEHVKSKCVFAMLSSNLPETSEKIVKSVLREKLKLYSYHAVTWLAVRSAVLLSTNVLFVEKALKVC